MYNISDSMATEEIRIATLDGKHISMLSELIPCSWPSTKVEVQRGLQPYWSFREEIAIIDDTEKKSEE